MKIHNNGYCFADLSIIPRIPKRANRDIDIRAKLCKGVVLNKPFISSPMDTVTDSASAIKLALNGAIGILHYNYRSKEDIFAEIDIVKNYSSPVINDANSTNGLPVGLLIKCGEIDIKFIHEIVSREVNFIAIDSLHSSPHKHISTIQSIKRIFPDLPIMSGNVVHPDDCKKLIDEGVTMLRVGYSAASINDGKNMFGTGRAQANAIFECADIAKKYSVPLIADGGIRNSGDVSIAFALGADFVMLGKIFASSYDTPGKIEYDGQGKRIKIYEGMSKRGLIDFDMLPEGKSVKLNADFSVIEILNSLSERLQMSISKAGATSLKDFYDNSELQLLTEQSIRETLVH